MAFTPTSGNYAVVTFTPNSTPITVPAINWNLTWDGNSKDVSNFRDGRRRVETLPDYHLSLTLVWDIAANPLLTANGGIALGTQLNTTLYCDQSNTNTKAWTGPVIVSTLAPKNEGVEGVVMLDVSCDANGTLTPPSV